MAEVVWLQILHLIAEIISYFTRSLELLIVIFLTIKLFKCDSHFKDAYYVILNIGYIFDLIKFINQIIHDKDTYLMRMVIHGWYSTYFLTLWNAILCCNRCTALAFPKAHKKVC
uniref:Uncharacterized protein n=1 Tax=Panagrolaimus davidi TaxID=227884 RepID=A0A914PMA8_9BILA